MARSKRSPRMPNSYKCANPACPRTTWLRMENHRTNYPDKSVEAERVHRVYDPSVPAGFALLCTCGHYSLVSASPATATARAVAGRT